jgi:hypothetical protein
MERNALYKYTDVSKTYIASIFRIRDVFGEKNAHEFSDN